MKAHLLSMAVVALGVAVSLASVTGSTVVPASVVVSDGLKCDLSQYKAGTGLTATMNQDLLAVKWTGQNGAELPLRFAVYGRQPAMRDFDVRRAGGCWTRIGENLTPEYHVVSGVRRLPNDQGNALRSLGVTISRDVIDQNRWQAFWDAPLRVPGTPEPAAGGRGSAGGRGAPAEPALALGEIPLNGGRVYELPRRPEEIKRATASFKATACLVKSEGASIEVTYPGCLWAFSQAISASRSIAASSSNGRARHTGEVGGGHLQRRPQRTFRRR